MSDKLPKQLQHREIIKCIPRGKYIGNYKCHVNCLSYALRHSEKVDKIIAVAQVFKDETTCAHFILKMADGTYYCPTYGNMSGVMDSHHIKIEEYEVENFVPNRELQNLKDHIFSMNSWLYRVFNANNY